MKKNRLFVALITGTVLLPFSTGWSVTSTVNKDQLTVCNLSQVEKIKTIPLSSLVESSTLVYFENTDAALFKPWFTTVTDKYIGVRQQGSGPYKLFSRSGKFLCNVGAVGNGPGEYAIAVYDDLIDDKNERIYLAPMGGKNILVYNTAGKYLKSIVAPQNLQKPKMRLSENGILTVLHMPFTGDKAMVLQFDATGKVIKQLAASPHFLVQNYDGEMFNTRNTSAFDFLHTSSDTLYHYDTKENKIKPVFTMKESTSKKSFKQYMELPRHYFTLAPGGLVATEKKTNKSSFIKIVNDSYGNLEMPGYIVNVRNGWYVCNYEPGQLITKIEKRLKESNCTAQDKQKLNKLLSTLDENGNNVLFVGKLK